MATQLDTIKKHLDRAGLQDDLLFKTKHFTLQILDSKNNPPESITLIHNDSISQPDFNILSTQVANLLTHDPHYSMIDDWDQVDITINTWDQSIDPDENLNDKIHLVEQKDLPETEYGYNIADITIQIYR